MLSVADARRASPRARIHAADATALPAAALAAQPGLQRGQVGRARALPLAGAAAQSDHGDLRVLCVRRLGAQLAAATSLLLSEPGAGALLPLYL